MQRLAEDVSDPVSQKAAFTFLCRCVSIWGQPVLPTSTINGEARTESHGLPGFEGFIYERLIPTAFRVPSLPEFNLKDGQMLVVSQLQCMWDVLNIYCIFTGPP
jgi:exportin-T